MALDGDPTRTAGGREHMSGRAATPKDERLSHLTDASTPRVPTPLTIMTIQVCKDATDAPHDLKNRFPP